MLFGGAWARGERVVAIAVNDFAAEGIQPSEARIISERLRSELLKSGVFRVLERGEMENILKEQGFQLSGSCTDKNCLVEVGQLLGVQHMVAGSIGKIGSLYTITARMIDIRSGEILFMVNEDVRGGLDDVLRSATSNVASRMALSYRQGEKAGTFQATAEDKPKSKREAKATASKKDVAINTDSTKPARTTKPLLRRPLFWVPLGAVVAGGAVVLIVANGGGDDGGEQNVVHSGEIEISW
jgi:TolB-like protein